MLRLFYAALRDVRQPDELVTLAGDELRYLMLARRSRIGDACELFDGQGHIAQATLAAIAPHHAELKVALPSYAAAAVPRIIVLQAFIKGDRMDQCIEKLVETGVDELLLVNAERTVAKAPTEKSQTRQQRWSAQVLAAARQCGRTYLPTIRGPLSLADAIALVPANADKRATDPTGAPWPMSTAVPMPLGEAPTMAIAIGPEGGFSPAEYEALAAAGFRPYAISPHILRAETAGPVAVALARAPAIARS